MITNVYVDGFNLYYGCLKDTAYRWLDLSTLCRLLLPAYDIHRIRYFTARLNHRPDNPQQRQRQQTYLRALATIPNLSIHYGHFLSHTARMPLAHPPVGGPNVVEALRTEEKGTDVNIATAILVDAFTADCEMVALLSNDSDLKTPLEVVRDRLGLRVGVYNPHKVRSHALAQAVDFYRHIRNGPLRASQFPPQLTDAQGIITKPASW